MPRRLPPEPERQGYRPCPVCHTWQETRSRGGRLMIGPHDHPDWPGQLCPGAWTHPGDHQ